jgi:hypothetical protein
MVINIPTVATQAFQVWLREDLTRLEPSGGDDQRVRNAGCIEGAVLSGLQAANAVRGRPRHHRIAGYYLP